MSTYNQNLERILEDFQQAVLELAVRMAQTALDEAFRSLSAPAAATAQRAAQAPRAVPRPATAQRAARAPRTGGEFALRALPATGASITADMKLAGPGDVAEPTAEPTEVITAGPTAASLVPPATRGAS